ncbi:MAG: alpha/beta fold hydrolase [Ilumatobacteraceae bacterium]
MSAAEARGSDGPLWAATVGPTDGPPIALIHGSLDRSAGMLKLSRRLDEEFRVTRYDRRGYGRSVDRSGPYGMSEQVADLLAVLSAASPEPRRWLLVGHSYGGNVALTLADRRPDLVAGVVVYESPMSWASWWPHDTAGADAVAWRADPEEAAERFMRRLVGDDRWDRLPPAPRAARRREGPAMVGELLDLRERAPWVPERIVAPVLAMFGTSGREHHRKAVAELGRTLPDAEVAGVDGARHFGPNTHPVPVAAMIRSFVARRIVVG